MNENLFYDNITVNENNKEVIENLKGYSKKNPIQQIYLITAPLGEKYSYNYEPNAIVILSPKHKLIFLDLVDNQDEFEEYYNDFLEDLNSISDKFNYKEHIGRPREWKKEVTAKVVLDERFDIVKIFKKYELPKTLQRKSELLISLLIGSINDIEKVGTGVPETILEKVKKKIVLFDSDQTRFIYKDYQNKPLWTTSP